MINFLFLIYFVILCNADKRVTLAWKWDRDSLFVSKKNFNNGTQIQLFATNGDGQDDNSTSAACNITTIISKASGTIKSTNYPNPYPTNCQWTYIIHVGVGHKLRMMITNLDVNTEEGDTLSILPSKSADINSNNNPRLFPKNSINSNDTFEISTDCCDSVIIKFIVGNHSNNHTGFSLTFQRNEPQDPEPSTKIQLPGWHQVYLCGISRYEFHSIEESFKESLLRTVDEYCNSDLTIQKSKTSTRNNVIINSIVPCPSSWPWSKNCFQLNFSITINDDSSELSCEHLAKMWSLYRRNEELNKFGIWEYQIPNFEWLFWFWIMVLCFISLLFCLLLLIILKTKLIYYYFKRLKIDELPQENTVDIINSHNQLTSFQFFTAENSHRCKFLKNVERTSKSAASIDRQYFNNTATCVGSKCNTNAVDDMVDDFDSEEQHIYTTVTCK